MSNTELMDNIEKQSGIIGPDTEEVTGLNELKTVTASAKKSSLLERTWRPALAFIVGIVGGVAACKPSNQEVINPTAPAPILTPNTAETASDQLVIGKPTATEVSETEQAPTKGKVYFKEYSAQPKAGSLEQPIPEDINKLITEALKTSPTAMKAFSTENPDVQINTALFTYFQTSEAEGKNFKEYVMFKDGQKYIIAGFKRVITLDPKDQYHYEYRTTQGNQAFIDYKFFKHLSPQLEKDPTLAETLVGDINRVEEAILGNPYTGKRFKYDQENPDNLSKFLAIFAPKTASAAEVTSILSPTTTATATKAPEPIPTPTAKPTEIPTPEVVKEVPCNIVPEKYCSQAEVIDWTGPTGQKGKMIGFHLPPEVPLFVPIDGQVAKAKLPDGVINGFEAIVFNPSDKTLRYIFDGDLQFDNMFSLNMKKGDVFGYTGKTGIENAGSYNVLFYILRGTGRDTTNAEDEMEKMFPEAFTKPAKQVTAPQVGKVGTVHINTFYDTSPK